MYIYNIYCKVIVIYRGLHGLSRKLLCSGRKTDEVTEDFQKDTERKSVFLKSIFREILTFCFGNSTMN